MFTRIITNLAVLLACFLVASNASLAQSIELNDIRPNSEGKQYTVGSNDPYIVFRYSKPIQSESTIAEVNISLNANTQDITEAEQSIEFFWVSGDENFSGDNRVKITLDNLQQTLLVPLELLGNNLTALRFDIDGCQGCLLSIDEPTLKTAEIDSSKPFDKAFQTLFTLKNGRDIPITEWVGQDLTTISPGKFSYYGWDPRIINTEYLSLPMDKASGIFLDFDYDLSSKVQALQLFMLFENSRWSPRITAHFAWIKNKDQQNNYKLFIPFDKFRSKKSLRQLRLDFPACKTCQFTLNQSRLVGVDEVEQYTKYIPERIHFINTELPSKRTIAREFLNKLKVDMPFNIFYVFILLATLVVTILLVVTSSHWEANK